MIRKYHNHTLQTNPRHREEGQQTFTVTRRLKDNKSRSCTQWWTVSSDQEMR